MGYATQRFCVFGADCGPVDGLYYAVTGMSTGGLGAPPAEDEALLFTGLFALVGVPLFGYTLSVVAQLMLEHRLIDKRVNEKMNAQITLDEFELASRVSGDGNTLDWGGFLEMQVLRLELSDEDTSSRSVGASTTSTATAAVCWTWRR